MSSPRLSNMLVTLVPVPTSVPAPGEGPCLLVHLPGSPCDAAGGGGSPSSPPGQAITSAAPRLSCLRPGLGFTVPCGLRHPVAYDITNWVCSRMRRGLVGVYCIMGEAALGGDYSSSWGIFGS